jgi:tetratricopeptide (TPR) repeat protein
LSKVDDWLEAEKENLLEAASWAAEQGQWEAVNWLVFDLYGNSHFLDLRGYVHESIRLLEMGVQASRVLDDARDEGAHLGNLGNAYAALGRVEEAIGYYEQALAISQEIGDRRGEGNRLGNLGEAHRKLDELDRAEALTQQALAIHREIGYQRGVGTWLHNLGDIAQARADQVSEDQTVVLLQQAKAHYGESLAIRREIKDPRAETETAPALETVLAKLRGNRIDPET